MEARLAIEANDDEACLVEQVAVPIFGKDRPGYVCSPWPPASDGRIRDGYICIFLNSQAILSRSNMMATANGMLCKT